MTDAETRRRGDAEKQRRLVLSNDNSKYRVLTTATAEISGWHARSPARELGEAADANRGNGHASGQIAEDTGQVTHMPEMNPGKWIVIAGLVLVAIGLLVMFGGKIGLGRLPGDIRYKSDGVTFYFPLATSILISILLTLILWIIRWFRQ